MLKSLLSVVAVGLTFLLFVPYIRSILLGHTKPHVFSWVIWAIGTFTVFLAQLAGGAGIGAWPIGLSGLLTGYVAVLSWLKRSDLSVTPFDWVCLLASFLAVPLWAVTSNPLWAVLILTGIDLIGFGPTIRKAHLKPHEDRIWFYLVGALRNGLVVAALERYTPTTVAFPAAVGVACVGVAIYVFARRQKVPPATTHRVAEQSHAAIREG
jgi:hypothetical protein